MAYASALFLHSFLFVQYFSCNSYTLLLSMRNEVRYQCRHLICSSPTLLPARNIQACQIACLNNRNCLTATYDRVNQSCTLFADKLDQYDSLVAETEIVTMSAIDDRLLSAISFPLRGVTVAGYGNGTAGNSNDGIRLPWGLALDSNGSLFVSTFGGYKVLKMTLGNRTGSLVAGTGVQGATAATLSQPAEIAVDASSNVYVADVAACRVMMWPRNATSGTKVAGNGTCANSASTIGNSVGLAVDSAGNVYVADYSYHRVMKWAANASFGTLVAGVAGTAGSDNQHLSRPYGLHLDENNSYLYIADYDNHRIQKYKLGMPNNGTTVAGGNGPGLASNQLDSPYAVCVSKKTGDIYIADKGNNRITRWSPRATNGVTIVGINGLSGVNATLLYSPANVILDADERFLYVSDIDNHRVQKYELP